MTKAFSISQLLLSALLVSIASLTLTLVAAEEAANASKSSCILAYIGKDEFCPQFSSATSLALVYSLNIFALYCAVEQMYFKLIMVLLYSYWDIAITYVPQLAVLVTLIAPYLPHALYVGLACLAIFFLWLLISFLSLPIVDYPIDDVLSIARSFSEGNPNADPSSPLLGHVAIVTGSTQGIGFEIASVLYQIGATVVVTARDANKGADTVKKIMERFPESKGEISTLELDTSDLLSVNNFVEQFKKKFNQLSILMNNAGIHYMSFGNDALISPDYNPLFKSKQNFDLAFATNYLGHFHFTQQLLDLMQATASKKRSEGVSDAVSRVVNMSSCYSFQCDGSMLESEECARGYQMMPLAARCDVNSFVHRRRAYSNNKLAQILHAKELTRRLISSGNHPNVEILAACPGWTGTNIIPNNPIGNFIRRNAFSTEVGICSAINAILNKNFKSGDMILNSKSPLFGKLGNKLFLRALTFLGLRDTSIDIISLVLLATQRKSFGPSADPTSPESYDERLSSSLFNWSSQVSNRYLQSSSSSEVKSTPSEKLSDSTATDDRIADLATPTVLMSNLSLTSDTPETTTKVRSKSRSRATKK